MRFISFFSLDFDSLLFLLLFISNLCLDFILKTKINYFDFCYYFLIKEKFWLFHFFIYHFIIQFSVWKIVFIICDFYDIIIMIVYIWIIRGRSYDWKFIYSFCFFKVDTSKFLFFLHILFLYFHLIFALLLVVCFS